jgi:pimeloyl-ACP methyl ester carboxylesterase
MIAPRYLRRLETGLASAGARLERVRYARPEAGGEVAAVRIVPRGRARGRIVVAHGAGDDHLYPFVALFHALAGRGFEVFSFDLDGHGAESTTTFADDTIDSAIPAAVRAAEAADPHLPLHLLGHSFGGSLALHALARGAVDGVRSAVAVCAPVSVEVTAGVALAELRGFLRPATLAQRRHYGAWGLVPAFGPVKRRAYPFRRKEMGDGAFGYVASVRALLARAGLERAAREVRVPTLLVYGRGDRLVPAAQGERLARAIPHAELVTVAGATHWGCTFLDAAVGPMLRFLDAHTDAEEAAA